MKQKKLELTWIGKDERVKLEPRILIEDPSKSYGDKNTENMLIHGDNLLALKALEQEFSGKIKCVFIDPPYNTGHAFEHYDDNLEHSIWLRLMKPRLELLRKLLRDDGSIWISIDEDECHYLKILCDEVFGRVNFVASVVWQHSIQGKNDAKNFSLHHNYILIYKKTNKFILKKVPREERNNTAYSNPDNDPRGFWRSGDVRSPNLRQNLIYNIQTPSGKVIKSPTKGWRWSEEKLKEKISTGEIIFSKDDSRIIRKIYLDVQGGRVPESIWFGEEVGTTREANTEIKTLFENDIFSTPKPERLIERILTIASDENDWVLDSFLGSGTTSAVAHKKNRKHIGIELLEQCYTHSLIRLKKVINGNDNLPLSTKLGWIGGGGFKFYELAPSLLNKDLHGNWIISKEYRPDMLASAMAKQEGFKYIPHTEIYWKQGQSTEKDYIFTTTNFITVEMLDKIHEEMKDEESLLICCKSYQEVCESRYENISIKKIPNILLGRCEFGKDDYSLNIINSPVFDEEEVEYETQLPEPIKKPQKKTLNK